MTAQAASGRPTDAQRDASGAPSTRAAMFRQFLRLYLTVVFPVIVIVVLTGWLSGELFTFPKFREQMREASGTRLAWVRDRLATVPIDQWKPRIDAARDLYPTGLVIDDEASFMRSVHPDSLELQHFVRGEVAFAAAPGQTQTLDGRAVRSTDRPARMTYAFQRVPDTTFVLSSQLSFADPSWELATLFDILVAVIAAAPILWFWFRPFWRDLEGLGRVTEQIGSGNFSVHAVPVRSATVKPFAAAIDQMSTRIGELVEAQRSLTNSVAHELTTPITQLTFALTMLRDAPAREQAVHLIDGMTEDLNELESLVAELLENARLDHTATFEPEDIDLRPLLERALEAARHTPDSGKVAALDPWPDDLRVRCDAHQMHRAVLNLLRNALRYARSRVALSAVHRDGHTWIYVDDDGPGIPSIERERLYEPFARIDASRTRSTGGHGLGLAIVQQVAKLHGGASRIEVSPLGGARVSIEW